MMLLEALADPTFAFLAASAALKYAVFYSWHNKLSKKARLVGRVSELNLYPVKSCASIALSEATCTFNGMSSQGFGDRSWIVTLRQADGDRMITARREPILELVRASVHEGCLHLDAPGMSTLKLPKHSSVTGAQTAQTNVWGQDISGLDCGEQAAKWLGEYLKKPDDNFRLLHFAPEMKKRNCSNGLVGNYTFAAKETDNIIYQDAGPFLLCSEQSLGDLNERTYKNFTMQHFRPNIVVTGCSRPFDEDSWEDIWIGDAKFTKLFLCDRCIMTTVDPTTGEQDPRKEPKETLEKYRTLVPKLSPMFGITMVTNKPADIKVGDPVHAITTDEIVVGNTGFVIDVSVK